MNPFEKASQIEDQSWEILEPLIQHRSFEGRFVRTARGPLARELQKSAGDVLMNTDEKSVFGLELKAEVKWTGNVFLERWSNRSRFTPGWFETAKCDLLLYHFLNNDTLYGFRFRKLREWFYYCENMGVPVASRYKLAGQKKHDQLNDTWGYIVPINDIPAECVAGSWNPKKMVDAGEADRWLTQYEVTEQRLAS